MDPGSRGASLRLDVSLSACSALDCPSDSRGLGRRWIGGSNQSLLCFGIALRKSYCACGASRRCGATACPRLLEDLVEPIEFDLMLEARVVHLAVGIAALDRANKSF